MSSTTNDSTASTLWIISSILPVIGPVWLFWVVICEVKFFCHKTLSCYKLTDENGDLANTHDPIPHSSWACDKTCLPRCQLIRGLCMRSETFTVCAASVFCKGISCLGIFPPFFSRFSGSNLTVPGHHKTVRNLHIAPKKH